MLKYQLDSKDYLELWKYCEEVAGRDKDRMVTISTWLLAFAVAIHAFILTKQMKFSLLSINIDGNMQVIVLAVAGIITCWIAKHLIYAFSAYANRYWFMADWLKKNKIEGLSEFHDKDVFIKAIKNDTNLLSKAQLKLISFTISGSTTEGVIGVFKTMLHLTNGLLYLFVIEIFLALVLGIMHIVKSILTS